MEERRYGVYCVEDPIVYSGKEPLCIMIVNTRFQNLRIGSCTSETSGQGPKLKKREHVLMRAW